MGRLQDDEGAVASRRVAITAALVGWYGDNARDLPWRRTSDPYAIWVSEVMLQQTRVATAVPYYERFLAEFPGVAVLAAAELSDVLRVWSGLGYYRRARLLHAAAGEVVDRHQGAMPTSSAGLRALTGVGPYTAGAVASIAYGERVAAVDGNVERVLARLCCIREPVSTAKARARIRAEVDALVPAAEPGAFNQALMELGATVCTPRAPRCDACPVRPFCAAAEAGLALELPVKKTKAPVPRIDLVAAVVRSSRRPGEVLLARRVKDGLFGGLWEPPMVTMRSPKATAEARADLTALGVPGSGELAEAGRVEHVLTHRRLVVRVLSGQAARATRTVAADPYEQVRWRRPEDVALSTLARKVLAAATLLVLLCGPRLAAAQPAPTESAPPVELVDADDELTAEALARYQRLAEPGGTYARLFGSLTFGRGLRFNNPYRLRTQLGSTGESVSLTAPHVDLGLSVAFGEPDGLQHGGTVHLTVALDGIGQQVLVPSYLIAGKPLPSLLLHARLGPAIVTAPDANVGGELAVGLSYFVSAALGLTAELVGDLFYGAGTYETTVTTVPILSLQLGAVADFEVLP